MPPCRRDPVTRVSRCSVRMRTPSVSSARRTIAEASGSSLDRMRAPLSTMVTWAPNRAKPWPNSLPIAPPPTTTRRRGTSARSQIVSLVHGAASRSPGTGGTVGDAPVARSARRKRSVVPSSIETVRGEAKRATPVTTSTPASRSASGESTGAMVLMASRMCSLTRAKSTATDFAWTPRWPAFRA